MTELRQELMALRSNALRAGAADQETAAVRPVSEVEKSLDSGFWRFADGNTITIVCARWPTRMLAEIPYTDIADPDYIELLTYSELDALFELHGHLRAANPANQVNLRIAGTLSPDDYSSHLVSLGGVDWNTITSTAMKKLPLPVQQIADWDTPGEQYFQVEENGETTRHKPELEEAAYHPKGILREDVALFARAVSPFNRERTVTICSGMYGRGTYGVIRALTDAEFRDRNSDYLRSRFGDSDAYCILTRVPIVLGATLTQTGRPATTRSLNGAGNPVREHGDAGSPWLTPGPALGGRRFGPGTGHRRHHRADRPAPGLPGSSRRTGPFAALHAGNAAQYTVDQCGQHGPVLPQDVDLLAVDVPDPAQLQLLAGRPAPAGAYRVQTADRHRGETQRGPGAQPYARLVAGALPRRRHHRTEPG